MTSNRTQLIARLSILTSLTVVLGYYTKLPTPTGIVTLLDLGVYFTAFYFGRKEGAIVGGVGAFLLDLIQDILSGCSLASSFTGDKAISLASRAKLVT